MSEMELEAVYTGVIKLDVYELPCYVLNNEMRVLSQREVVKLITGGRESGNLMRYLDARALQSFLPDKFKLKDDIEERNSLTFRAGTTYAKGIQASDLVDICNAYLKARQAGLLAPQQAKLAEQAEMFISACAKTGIDAIVDEVTGFQYYRKANELQEKFKAYLQAEYRAWALTFPRQFFLQLYKLEGIKPPSEYVPYPKRFGKYVMNFVYDTLDPDIADHLRENNPNPSGIKHHHQLFNDFGYKNLQDHVISVLGIMKASINMDRFKENIAIAFPNLRTQRKLRLDKQKKISASERIEKSPVQMTMFDLIETSDSPSKEEFAEMQEMSAKSVIKKPIPTISSGNSILDDAMEKALKGK